MAESLDGALAVLLTRVMQSFSGELSSETSVRGLLSPLGVKGVDADTVWAFVSANSGNIAGLNTGLPGLMAQLRSSNPDLTSLIRPAKDLWTTVEGLVTTAPNIDVPALPGVGSILDVFLSGALDTTLQAQSPLGWAFFRSIGLIGPDVPIVDALGDIVQSPTAFVWKQWEGQRRNLDVTVAGLLTGPRTSSALWTTAGGAIAPEVKVALPTASTVVARVTVRFAADTFDEPVPVVVEILGDDAQPPTFVAAVIRTPPWLAPLQLSDAVTLDLQPLTNPLGVALTGFGSLVPLAAGQPELHLSSTFRTELTFGPSGGLHVTLAEPLLRFGLGASSWSAAFGFGRFEIVIPNDVAGPIVGLLLPKAGITIRGKLVAAMDGGGFHLDGGVGLSASWPDTLRLPGVLVRDLKTDVTVGAEIGLAAYGTVVITLGPLTVSIEGLGVSQLLRITPDGSGNLGVVELAAPALRMPTGFGVSVDAVILKGGGFLRVEGDEISGALELALTLGPISLTVRAVAVLGTVDGAVSFIVVMSVEFTPAIEIFLGLTLNAVGGIFGLNRTLDPEGLGDVVRSGRMDDVMFPEDLAARAIEVIAAVKKVFPARRGQFVVGPMLKLGWGRPVSFVTLSVGVVFTFPKPVIVAVVGNLHLALPADALALVNLNCSFAGGIRFDTGDVWFDASLARSTIGTFDVGGDLCLRAGGTYGFIFSAGGFHPKFTPPPGLPAVRRLSISISPSPILSMRAEAYFAVTSSTLQFGAHVVVKADLGPIGIDGDLGLDVLFQTEPRFHFIAEISGHFRLTVFGDEVCGISIDLLLEGPGRWHARAHASFHFLFVSVSGTLDLSWGDDAPEDRPAVDVARKVHDALEADPVWAHVVPAVDSGLVHVRAGASALHPLGSLRLTQTAAPLNRGLTRFGPNKVTSVDPVQAVVTAAGAGAPVIAQELFAPAQFFDMTDDERLSKPQFVPFDAGSVVSGDQWSPAVDPLTVDVIYEESTSDTPAGFREKMLTTVDVGALAWSITGAAGRSRSNTVAATTRPITVNEVTYAVADATTGRALSAFASNEIFASMAVSADRVTLADYEMAAL